MPDLLVTLHELIPAATAPMRVEIRDERICYEGHWYIRRTTIHPDSEPVWLRVNAAGIAEMLGWPERDRMERTYWMEAAA